MAKHLSARSLAPIVAPQGEGGSKSPEITASAFSEIELYRFGGLKGLRRHGHFKEVRMVDPLLGGSMLHFPTVLHSENWILSCFSRSLECHVPMESFKALDHGKIISTRCSLILKTPKGVVGDLVMRKMDEKGHKKWTDFQKIAKAHGFIPCLRLPDDIRKNNILLDNLDRIRQKLVQSLPRVLDRMAMRHVLGILKNAPNATVREVLEGFQSQGLAQLEAECAVIFLYREKVIDLNIDEAIYGKETKIKLL